MLTHFQAGTDSIRQNINAFADDLLSKDKTASNEHPIAGQKTDHVSDSTGSGIAGSGNVHTGTATTGTTQSSGIHPDAQAIGSEIEKGFNNIGKK